VVRVLTDHQSTSISTHIVVCAAYIYIVAEGEVKELFWRERLKLRFEKNKNKTMGGNKQSCMSSTHIAYCIYERLEWWEKWRYTGTFSVRGLKLLVYECKRP